jgi:hypothetical protein
LNVQIYEQKQHLSSLPALPLTPPLTPSFFVHRWIGEGDKRYVQSNAFIVSSGGILAVVVGPGCLFFAYTIYRFVKLPESFSLPPISKHRHCLIRRFLSA